MLLSEQHYSRIRPLFDGSHLVRVSDSIIAGNSPVTIYVDDARYPESTLIWDYAHCIYFAGEADHQEFNVDLRQYVTTQLLPEAQARHIGIVKVYTTHAGWLPHLSELFPDIVFTPAERIVLTLQDYKPLNWQERLPAGFDVRPVNRDLLMDGRIKNAQQVRAEVESCWTSLARFSSAGFGFCMVRENEEVVCWCTAEYVSEGHCGVGIETIEAYTGRGFATITAAAFVEHCVSSQIAPHWDSWANNRASIAVAEKVGFREALSYRVHVGSLT